MPIDQRRVNILRNFELSDYAARAYLGVLALGSTTARDVSRISRVPMSKVHATLATLHERGLVDVLPETPRRYAPRPFSAFLDKRRAELAMRLDGLDRNRDVLAREFPITANFDVGSAGGLTLVRGRRNVLEEMQRLGRRARNDVLYLATAGDARTGRFLDALVPHVPESVSMRVCLPAAPAEGALTRAPSWLLEQTRVTPNAEPPAANVALLLVDGTVAMKAHLVPDDATLDKGDDVAFVVDRGAFVSWFGTVAEDRWQAGEPLEASFRRRPRPDAP